MLCTLELAALPGRRAGQAEAEAEEGQTEVRQRPAETGVLGKALHQGKRTRGGCHMEKQTDFQPRPCRKEHGEVTTGF